jgi:hypothetical protein
MGTRGTHMVARAIPKFQIRTKTLRVLRNRGRCRLEGSRNVVDQTLSWSLRSLSIRGHSSCCNRSRYRSSRARFVGLWHSCGSS